MYRAQDMPPRVAKALALQAPTGGINDLDPLAAMESAYMLDCLNFYPDTGIINARPGYQEWAVGLGMPVKTIMSFNAQSGAFERFASTDTGVYDITASVTAPPVEIASPGGEGAFIETNFATPAGQFLIACNGSGTISYDGTTWLLWTENPTPAGPGQIKGVNPDTFSYVLAHKARLWFLQKNSMNAYYLPVDAVGGEAKPFFLGGIFKRGGHLVSMARWSSDTGEGLDDRLVFVSSTGEVASYNGTDPEDSLAWSLDSMFYVAAPLSLRSVTDYGGDVLLLCRRGLVPLSTLLSSQATEVLYSGALSRRISRTLIRLTSIETPPFPPEVTLHSEAAWVVINVFDGTFGGLNRPIQLIMNFLTGAWGKFDYPVRTVKSIDKSFFMGTDDGRVLIVTPDTFVDNVNIDGEGGIPIECYAFGAYTYLDNPTVNKHAKLVRPVFQSEVQPSFLLRVLPDFRLDRFTAVPPPNPAQGNARWDISNWDEANWAGTENVYRPWVSANVLGFAFAWQINLSTSSRIGLAAFEWVWEEGGYV